MVKNKYFLYNTDISDIIDVRPFNVDGFIENVVFGQTINSLSGLEVGVSRAENATSIKIRIVRCKNLNRI